MRDARRSFRAFTPAFTLVELLVVIGIIGALIAILLPVLSGVQARGRDLKCQSNIRSIVQAMLGYAAENKGSLPYGFYFTRSVQTPFPGTWNDAGGDDGRFISWASQVGKYMGKRLDGDNEDNNFPPVLRCPEADQVYNHVVSYVINMIVGVAPYYELQVGQPPNAQLRPAVISQLIKSETALIWDTAIQSDWENNVGFLQGSDIDQQRFWNGADVPQYRYFSANDPFGQFPPGTQGNNKPVLFPSTWKNSDPPAGTQYPFQGNLRFRHNKGTTCNIGWSDGHVSNFTARINSNGTMKSHDALRRFFMIKWPTGAIPKDGIPS